jgi:dTDP-6-deoxy-L-talose 4-dehydrogenase (NAD+)
MSLVLLTGATGFVGRQVLRALSERGAMVRVVIRKRGKAGSNVDLLEKIVTTPDLFAEDSAWWAEICRGRYRASRRLER